MIRPPQRSPPFPNTPLSRSADVDPPRTEPANARGGRHPTPPPPPPPPPILQRFLRQRPERPAIPLHHRGHQLSHDNRCIRWKQIERRTQSKSHSKTANQNARPLQPPRPFAAQRGQRFFRPVHAARHKHR